MITESATTGQAPFVRRRRDQDMALAEEELRWNYQSSDAALGERSTWEAMVTAAQIGGGLGGRCSIEMLAGEPTHPGPNQWQIWAANRQTRIRRDLRKLTRSDQAVLEATFKIRRADKQLAGLFGARVEPVVTYLRRLGVVKLKRDGDATDRLAIKNQAEKLLDRAMHAYIDAKESREPEFQRPKRQPVQKVQAGDHGAAKRRLVPVSLDSAPWVPEVYAA